MKRSTLNRVFCDECGAIRIHNSRSPYAVCPNGHGRLVRRFTSQEQREAILETLPQAQRVGRHAFQIAGHDGLFDYRAGSGRRPVGPDASVQANEVVACYQASNRVFVRVFAQKSCRRRQCEKVVADVPTQKQPS